MMAKKLNPVHPGEILQKEFLEPMGLSQNRLALALGVPAMRINEIVLDTRVEIPAIAEMVEGTLARMYNFSEQNDLNSEVLLYSQNL